jgi:hypothetical protein
MKAKGLQTYLRAFALQSIISMVEHLHLLVITNFTLVATLLNTLVWTNLAYHSSKSISLLVVTQLPK